MSNIRTKGIGVISNNYEAQLGRPLDGKMLVPNLNALTSSNSWIYDVQNEETGESTGEIVNVAYKGMIVGCAETGEIYIYQGDGNNFEIKNWKKIGSDINLDDVLQEAKDYADSNDADTKYGIEYDSINKKIKLVEDGSTTEIDASDFIKDGMINEVSIDANNNLIITFNTDSGKEDITLSLFQLIDVYTGVEGDRIKVTVGADNTIDADLVKGSISKDYLDEGVKTSLALADSAVQAGDLIDYTVTITATTEGLEENIAKKYTFTQNGSTIGTIDLAKDLVVTSGNVYTVVLENVPYEGAVVGDKYIALTIANQSTPIYVPVKDLVDVYTASTNADEVQVVINENNMISASLTEAVKSNIANGTTAYGWGDHAQAGYVKTDDLGELASKDSLSAADVDAYTKDQVDDLITNEFEEVKVINSNGEVVGTITYDGHEASHLQASTGFMANAFGANSSLSEIDLYNNTCYAKDGIKIDTSGLGDYYSLKYPSRSDQNEDVIATQEWVEDKNYLVLDSYGTSGQVLTSTGSGVEWSDASGGNVDTPPATQTDDGLMSAEDKVKLDKMTAEPSLTVTFSSIPDINTISWADNGLIEVDADNVTCRIYGIDTVVSSNSIVNGGDFRTNLVTSVVIGNSVTSIGDGAFYGCTSLTSVVIPDSVTSIGSSAFYSCNNLTSVIIPDSVTSIGDYAFRSCYSLTSVVIGDSVTTIGEGAFAFCDNLTSMTFKNPTPLDTLNSNVILNSVAQIIVPINSVDAYKVAKDWSAYANKITAVATQEWVTIKINEILEAIENGSY